MRTPMTRAPMMSRFFETASKLETWRVRHSLFRWVQSFRDAGAKVAAHSVHSPTSSVYVFRLDEPSCGDGDLRWQGMQSQ